MEFCSYSHSYKTFQFQLQLQSKLQFAKLSTATSCSFSEKHDFLSLHSSVAVPIERRGHHNTQNTLHASDAENYSRSIRNDTEYAYLLLICGAVHNRMTSQESNKNL